MALSEALKHLVLQGYSLIYPEMTSTIQPGRVNRSEIRKRYLLVPCLASGALAADLNADVLMSWSYSSRGETGSMNDLR